MKKLFLSVATLMCATLMFSQNTSDVKQTGFNQSADVDQQGYNEAFVEQNVESNVATITQDGDGFNDATKQKARIIQNGYANDADVVQGNGIAYGNKTYVRQHGDMNVSRQTQLGDYNRGLIVQGHPNYGSGYANLAVQEQYSPLNVTKGNEADIWQFGTENVAYQTQFGKENNAYIEQWTGYNYASQFQDGTGNSAVIGQDGMRNNAKQEQFGDGNMAWATQTFYEDWDNDALSGDNLSKQIQYGDENEAYVSQDRYSYLVFNTTAGGDTYSLVDPVYNGSKHNRAFQNQYDNNHRAFSNQTGMHNLSVQDQFGDGNFSYMQQDGMHNYAVDLQSGFMNRSGVYQTGEWNESYVTQTGSLHSSLVDQDGYDNKTVVQQN